MSWTIILTKTARKMLTAVPDRRLQEKICDRIEDLKEEPEKQGKALTANLSGLSSIRVIGQRYRIIYQLQDKQVTVLIIAIGIRKQDSKRDIYELAKRLVNLGLARSID